MNSGIVFGPAICIVGGLFLIAVVIFELRKTPQQEAEREDEAMSRVGDDDTHEMGRWVP